MHVPRYIEKTTGTLHPTAKAPYLECNIKESTQRLRELVLSMDLRETGELDHGSAQ